MLRYERRVHHCLPEGGSGAAGGTASLAVGSAASLTDAGTLEAWDAGSVTLASPARVGAVATSGNGKIDLTDSAMIVDYLPGASPIDEVASLIRFGYAGGSWNGSGIDSSTAASMAASPHRTALGYGEASALGVGSFAGQTVDSTSLLVRYTFTGDANLDGKVDTLDFNALAANFGGSGKVWSQADFNFDGVVDTLDFNNLAANFGQQLPAQSPISIGATLVPEPDAMLWLVVLGLATRWRRRRIR